MALILPTSAGKKTLDFALHRRKKRCISQFGAAKHPARGGFSNSGGLVMTDYSRRNFLYLTGAGAIVGAASQGRLQGQQEIPPPVAAVPIYPYEARSPV